MISFSFRSVYKIICLSALLLSGGLLHAQENADKIIAVVGKSKIILQSELDEQSREARKQDPNSTYDDATYKCLLLQQMIIQKLLVEQADRDSVVVSDDEVEGQLENR